MANEFKIQPSTIEPNFIPSGIEPVKEQAGFAIDDTPATNEKPVEPSTNYDDMESVNKPEDNATKSQIFAQNSAPTKDFKEGDLWFDTDDNNKIYRANSTLSWVSVKDGTILEGATTTFRQAGVPTALAAKDIWFDSDDSDKQYVATSAGDDQITAGEWERVDVGANPTLVDALATTNAPAAAGADVTASNTAAAIASQGDLATQDTADFDTDVDGAEKPANNATVGAKSGTNLVDESDASLGDTDIVTEEGRALSIFETLTAGGGFVAGQLGFMGGDAKVYHIDGLTSELDDRFIGAALETIAKDASGKFQIKGKVTLSSLSTGVKYYSKIPTPTGDQTTTVDTYNALDGDGNDFCGQTFEVATVKPITHIRMRLYYSGGGIGISSFDIKVYATSGGVPTGSALATATGYTPTITTGAQWIDFYFDTPFIPVASTTYCFITSGSLHSAGYLRCIRSNTGYADGTALTNKDGGGWQAEADDISFGIYQGTGELATTGSDKLIGIARSTTELSLR